MNLKERFEKFKKTFLEHGKDFPTLYDQEAGVGFVKSAAGEGFIRRFAAEHGRELIYPFDVLEVVDDGPLPEGLYMQTNFMPEELYPNMPLVAAHGEICTNILLKTEKMLSTDILFFNPSGFVTQEGFAVAQLLVVNPRQILSTNIDA